MSSENQANNPTIVVVQPGYFKPTKFELDSQQYTW